MKKNLKSIIISCVFLSVVTQAAIAQLNFNTSVLPPVSPFLNQMFSQAGGGVRATLLYSMFDSSLMNPMVKVSGRIQRLSPSPFTIELKNDTSLGAYINLFPGSRPLSRAELEQAFGNFNENNLNFSGISPNDMREAGKLKLPDGIYSICFTAQARRYVRLPLPPCCPNNCDDVGSVNCKPVWQLQRRFVNVSPPGCASFTIVTCTQPAYGVLINTTVKPPVNPVIAQTIAAGGVNAALQFSNPPGCNAQVKLFGKIERLSPSPFTIALNPNYEQQKPVSVAPGTTQLSPNQMLDAFGNFIDNNLVTTGIDLASLKDANNNIKLPDGNYRICFYARYITSTGALGGNASDPNLGCGTFSLCYKAGSTPQFTQPVNNLNINAVLPVILPVSPVIFTWTPPQSTCGLPAGGYTYDFEIWEILNNQTVTDAINNPFVFQKTALPSTTFLLDTNSYKNVLQQGKKYAIRVRARIVSTNSPVEIDNNGYSRVEAFQYGNSPDVLATPFPVQPPQFYYIPFGQRNTDFWDDVYTAYQNNRRRDTVVPIREYIALNLIQNGIAYGTDAIELFMALNPELAGFKEVRLSNKAKLPVFPTVSESDRRKFDEQHAANLRPDTQERNRFKNYLDSLNRTNYQQRLKDTVAKMISDLTVELNNFNTNVQITNRVSVNLINNLLAELLYNLHQRGQNPGTKDDDHYRSVVANIRELMTNSSPSSSLLWPLRTNKRSSLSSYTPTLSRNTKQVSHAGYIKVNATDNAEDFFVIEGPLLPVDVIVWRGAAEPPRAVSNAPELRAAYRIFYTTPPLYNHKNPRINANELPGLASTAQVSLPMLAHFKFWSLNMVNQRRTSAIDVETNDVFFLNNKKKWPNSKRLYVVLKVD